MSVRFGPLAETRVHSEGCALGCASLHDLTSGCFGCNLVLLIEEEAGHTLRARD